MNHTVKMSNSMYKIEKKDKRLFMNAGSSLRGFFTRRSKRSKRRSETTLGEAFPQGATLVCTALLKSVSSS